MPIFGTEADDLLVGIPGAHDIIFGRGGDDTLRGGDGNDVLDGGPGADTLDGGEDDGWVGRDRGHVHGAVLGDTVAYTGSDAGVTVDLATGTAEGGHAEGDTLTGIESVRGSDHADALTARIDEPMFDAPYTFDSTLWGQKGDDVLNGGAGIDLLWGGKGDDTLMGGLGSDIMEGGAGADVLNGGGDWDTEFGFPCRYTDTLAYVLSDAGVTVDLATGTAAGGHAEGDTFTGFEHIHGSEHADHLTGDDGNNGFGGLGGDDTLVGGGGNDVL